jgi:lysophospholipase L1-like esterase
VKLILSSILAAAAALAQPAPVNDAEARKLAAHAAELIEASALPSPELARAAAPLAESIRFALETLKVSSGQPPAQYYKIVENLRAYLLLTDTLPKSAPLIDEARKQIVELRETHERLEHYFVALLDRTQQQLLSPDRDQTARYLELNKRAGAPQAGKPRVVFLGDSITDLWRLNEYFPDRDFHNRGISGQITSQMLARFRADVASLKPAAVVILAGTNDLARGYSLEVITNNLAAMGDLADHYKIKVLLASILPVSDYHKTGNPLYERTRLRQPDKIRALNDWVRDFCLSRDYVYVNYWPSLSDERGMLKADLAADGLHPDAAGYRLMAPAVLQAIEKALGPAQPSRGRTRR